MWSFWLLLVVVVAGLVLGVMAQAVAEVLVVYLRDFLAQLLELKFGLLLAAGVLVEYIVVQVMA
jgi:hypothetical protein